MCETSVVVATNQAPKLPSEYHTLGGSYIWYVDAAGRLRLGRQGSELGSAQV